MTAHPQLDTERLHLRRFELKDLPTVVELLSDKVISDNVVNIPFPYGKDDAVQWLNGVIQGYKQRRSFVFAITPKGGEEVIGAIGLHVIRHHNRAEMGYWIGQQFWNKGYASEAVSALLKFGFETLKLNKIHANHFVDNPASGKVLSNNRMVKESTLIDHYKKGDQYKTVVQYRLTKEEFENLEK